MSFRISGLSPEPFKHLFGLDDAALREHGAIRHVVDQRPGYPERIELRDAAIGESVLLVNYMHQPADTPYRSSYAIYVREGAEKAAVLVDEVPEVMHSRMIALRAFDADHMLINADLARGDQIAVLANFMLADHRAAYLHAHYARYGCYAARVDRA